MDLQVFSNLIQSSSLTFLLISPTIFIFSVTLLGSAIERARQEERAARENIKTTIQKNIGEIEKSINEAKKNGDTTAFRKKLDELKIEEQEAEKRVREIKIKYTAIDFTNTAVYPCGAFLAALILSATNSYFETFGLAIFFMLFSESVLIAYGVGKIYWSLRLVQEISAGKKESEQLDQLKNAFKDALEEYDQSKTAQVEVTFKDRTFPLSVAADMDLKLNFKIKLTKGVLIKDAEIWFYVADGFGLIAPPESASWRQPSDYTPPNIRTVKVILGNLSIGPSTPGTLHLKAPSTSGKYLLRYGVYGEGFSSGVKDLSILVG